MTNFDKILSLCTLFVVCKGFSWRMPLISNRGSAIYMSNIRILREQGSLSEVLSPSANIRYDFVNNEEEEEEEEEQEAPAEVESDSDNASEVSFEFNKESASFNRILNGSDVRVGIIMARWNEDIIKNLYNGVNSSLYECGVKPGNIFTTYVPGSFELPVTARFLAASKRVDVIICIGCLIKGDTMHFEYIAQAVANGIMQVSLETYLPCIFGVLTVLNVEQAVERSVGKENLGIGWGKAAVEMGLARLSALGQGQMKSGDPTSAFVTFNTNGTAGASTGEKEGSKPRKIGF